MQYRNVKTFVKQPSPCKVDMFPVHKLQFNLNYGFIFKIVSGSVILIDIMQVYEQNKNVVHNKSIIVK